MSVWDRRANEIFLEAIERPESDRATYLNTACNGDSGLRRQVEGLLAAASKSRDFIEQPIVERPSDPVSRTSIGLPQFEGKYCLEEKIGAGGMGVVYAAKQTTPIVRKVAVKLIRNDIDNQAQLARFEQERQALALMDHPNIAKVFDAGTTESGQPYLVMEFLAGAPLVDFCDRAGLTVAARLELFVSVCRGLHHAHQKGVIHRDLKPSNILVSDLEGRPTPKLIDFGVAKVIGPRLIDRTIQTGQSMLVGTLEYMAPEQAALSGAEGNDVDTRCDVYSMGVILYELLTSVRPFDRERLKKASLDEVVRIVRDEEPPKLVERLSNHMSLTAAAANRRTDPKTLLAVLSGDLNWIVFRCLAKDRDRRYASANDLANDVQRYLSNEPIEARPPSSIYRLQKLVQRRRGAAIAASMVLLSLVGGTIGTTIGFVRADRARKAEIAERESAEAARDQAWDALDAMTSSLARDSLVSQQEVTPDQKEFLARAVDSYRSLASREAHGELHRRRAANAARRVADIQEMLGRLDESIDSHLRAIEMFAELVNDFPNEVEYRRVLGGGWGDVGRLYSRTRRSTNAAETSLRRAVETVLAAHAKSPEHRQCQLDSVVHLQRLASYLQDGGRLDDALEPMTQSRAILERSTGERTSDDQRLLHAECESLFAINQLRRKDFKGAEAHLRLALEERQRLGSATRGSPRNQGGLSADRRNLGRLLAASNRREEGFREFREAMTVQRKLVERFPSSPIYRHALASTMMNFALEVGAAGDSRERKMLTETAIAECERLVAEFPDSADYSMTLGGAYCNLGIQLHGESRSNEAVAVFDKAVAQLERGWTDAPSKAERTEFLGNSLFSRALAHQKMERWPAAAADLRRGIALSVDNVDFRVRLAFCLVKDGRADESVAEIEMLDADAKLTASQRFLLAAVQSMIAGAASNERHDYADRAMKNLERSLRGGAPQPWSQLKSDAFAPLRSREDFQRLVQEFPSPKTRAVRTPTK